MLQQLLDSYREFFAACEAKREERDMVLAVITHPRARAMLIDVYAKQIDSLEGQYNAAAHAIAKHVAEPLVHYVAAHPPIAIPYSHNSANMAKCAVCAEPTWLPDVRGYCPDCSYAVDRRKR